MTEINNELSIIKAAEALIRSMHYKARAELALYEDTSLCYGKANGSWCIHVIRDGQRLLPAVLSSEIQSDLVDLLPELVLEAKHAHLDLIQEINDSANRLENWLKLVDECETPEEAQVVNDEWINGHLPDNCAVGRARDADESTRGVSEVPGPR